MSTLRIAFALFAISIAHAMEPETLQDGTVLSFQQWPIAEIIAAVNRVNPKMQLVLRAPLGERIVTGQVKRHEAVEKTAEMIRIIYGLKETRTIEDGITIITLEPR